MTPDFLTQCIFEFIGTLVLVALLGLAGPTLFGVSMLNTRIHGAVGEVQDKVRRRRES